MITDRISIANIKNIKEVSVKFDYPESNIIVVTGKNGVGKTTLIKAFKLADDPKVFGKSSGEFALSKNSKVDIELQGIPLFSFSFNEKFNAMDTRDDLPPENEVYSELPIPYGERFSRFSAISGLDSELRVRIGSSDYKPADDLIRFLQGVYSSDEFGLLKQASIKGENYYFILRDNDYYLREDHFSSGEYFLIQLYRIITSGAKLILIDEIDVALDGVAQANLYGAIKQLAQRYDVRLIVVSHSLAFMRTVDEGGLYYLESNNEEVSLDQRSYGYIKSDLYGFRGFDKYILTEDPVLEGFIDFSIRAAGIKTHYQHTTIGVNGFNQVQSIIEKNDNQEIFSLPENVLCIIDGDVYPKLIKNYRGPTKVLSSPFNDIELFLYENRERLFPDIPLPTYQESNTPKKASKSYWKYLTIDRKEDKSDLYQKIYHDQREGVQAMLTEIEAFLGLPN